MLNRIASMAASRIGYHMDRILEPGDPANEVVAANYDTIVQSELMNYAWFWADTERNFPCRTPEEHECQYEAVVDLSEDILRVRWVQQCGNDLRYDRVGRRLLLWKVEKQRQVTVRGQWLNDLGEWPKNFEEVIVNRFAALLSATIMQRPQLAQYFDQRAEGYLARAKTADSQQQTVNRIRARQISAARGTPYTSPRQPRGRRVAFPDGGS